MHFTLSQADAFGALHWRMVPLTRFSLGRRFVNKIVTLRPPLPVNNDAEGRFFMAFSIS
jgi:hypothetical protein